MGGGAKHFPFSSTHLLHNSSSYQTLFTAQKNSKQFSRYKRSKPESTIGSQWEAQTKTAIPDYLTKNPSPPTFLKQFTSNLQEMFPATIRKICRKQFKKR